MIGNMIAYERSKQGISAQRLSEGVCSVSALKRLESGVRLPDFFVLERLIERLGKSVNKMEFLYDEGAYDIYYLREIIEKAWSSGSMRRQRVHSPTMKADRRRESRSTGSTSAR